MLAATLVGCGDGETKAETKAETKVETTAGTTAETTGGTTGGTTNETTAGTTNDPSADPATEPSTEPHDHSYDEVNVEIVVAADGSAAERHAACSCGDIKTTPYEGTYVRGDEAFEFDADGKRVPRADGFLQYAGNTYYIINNIIVKNYFIIDGKVYDFGEDGVRKDTTVEPGLHEIGGETYYVEADNMVATGNKPVGDTMYRFDESGKRVDCPDGFAEVGGNTYYIINNIIVKNYFIIDGKVYDFGEDGVWTQAPLNGILQVDGELYFAQDSELVKDSYVLWEQQIYRPDGDGKLLTNTTYGDYSFGADGALTGEGTFYIQIGDTTYKVKDGAAMRHEHNETPHAAKTPTCTEIGWDAYVTCSACGYTSYSEKAALGHDEVPHAAQDPTCTEIGWDAYVTCSRCDHTTYSEKAALGHDEQTDEAVVPTCTKTGMTEGKHCSVCGEVLVAQTVVPATGHRFVNDKCEYCGKETSKGLSFLLSDDDKSYVVTRIGSCRDTNIVIPSEYGGKPVTRIGSSAFSGCTGLTSITIPDSVTSIGGEAFYKCTGLTSITIPDSVTSIAYCAFYKCTGLTRVTIGNGVTSIGRYAFEDCSSLTSIIIPDGVTSIGSCAFENCRSLTSITIPDSVTSIGYCAFYKCTCLTSITIGNGVTSIGYEAFYGCAGLTSITIPDRVTSIGSSAFEGCSSLTSITIGNGVTSIGYDAFSGCTGLTSITIPDSVTSIGWGAFYGCSSLTSITIPDGVTHIGNSAFKGCSSLTSITIPDGVTSIRSSAFYVCKSLTSITFTGTKAQWNAISKGYNWDFNTGPFTVHCTDGDIPWSQA